MDFTPSNAISLHLIVSKMAEKLAWQRFYLYSASPKYKGYTKKNVQIGKYLDSLLSLEKGKTVFAEKSGTIKSKVEFCKKAIEIMEDPDFSWKLTEKLQDICHRVFKHIKENN
jgi:hypothetical protein